MNCKPGDIAFYTGNGLGPLQRLIGIPFEILHPTVSSAGSPAWVTDPSPGKFVGIPGVYGIADHVLRPIRDPGDDAVDEMVLRVGKPEGVAA